MRRMIALADWDFIQGFVKTEDAMFKTGVFCFFLHGTVAIHQ